MEAIPAVVADEAINLLAISELLMIHL